MDGMPFTVCSHYLPLERVYDVIRTYTSGSLHQFLLDNYGIKVRRTISMIRAVLPDQDDRKLLEIMGNSPVLLVKSVNVDEKSGIPMELAVTRFKAVSTQLIVEPD